MCLLVAEKKKKSSGYGQKTSEESQITYWILKSTPSKAESWQSLLAQAAKPRTMVIACHI